VVRGRQKIASREQRAKSTTYEEIGGEVQKVKDAVKRM
jgi:hypothetical protein